MNVCTLGTQYSDADIYKLMSDFIVANANLFDFNAIVGDMDQAGGCEAWMVRVMALADDLEVRAAYDCAMITQLEMRDLLKMHRAEGKRRAAVEQLRQATKAIERQANYEAAGAS